jgi:AcrR family transcriptional regulator
LGNAIDTKRRILDAAELLFADKGFDAVSVREVAKRAQVLLGQITYHFSSKENLFEEVIARRAVELNGRRRAALRDLKHGTIEEVLDTYLRPYLDLVTGKDSGWRAYGRLIAQTGQSSRWQKISARHFSDLGHRVIDLMIDAEPGLARPMAIHAYVHMVSVMFGVFAASGLIDIFSDGTMSSADLPSTYKSMIRFAAGGIRALIQSDATQELSPATARKNSRRAKVAAVR